MRRLTGAIVAATVVLVVSGTARAASITYTGGFDDTHQDGRIERFNPLFGTLTSVEFTATGSWQEAFSVASPPNEPVSGSYQQRLEFLFFGQDGSVAGFSGMTTGTFSSPRNQFLIYGSIDFAATGAANLGTYLGTGLSVVQVVNRVWLLPPLSGVTIPRLEWAYGTMSITYNFDRPGTPNPIPEPASLAMLPLGLIVVARLARHRRRVA
jgi:hypothetical protein